MKKQINIFIISPDDVLNERKIAREICNELNDLTDENTEIKAVLWQDYPMPYGQDPQKSINGELEKGDIFVVILWHRLGTVIEGYEGAITYSRNVTGTQYEIEKIIAMEKDSVFFYMKKQEQHFSSNNIEEASYQKELLNDFLQKINLTEGSTKNGYHNFNNSSEFRKKLRNHLKVEIEKRSTENIRLPKNVRLDNIKNSFYLFVIGLFIVIAFFFLGGRQEEVKIQKKIIIPVVNKNINNIFLEINDKTNGTLASQTYYYFLEALTIADIEVSMQISKSASKILLNQKTKDTIYIVSEVEMVKAECSLSCSVIDLHKNSTIYAMTQSNEVTHFNRKDAKKKCLSEMYENMSKKLIETFNRT